MNKVNRVIIEGMHSNFIFKKSALWKMAIIHLNNIPYYRILPVEDTYLSLKKNKNATLIKINDRVIFERPDLFKYKIHIELKNKNVKISEFIEKQK
jgi:hypothetical protein